MAFLERPLDGEWPYLWLDATYLKQREGGRIVSVAAIIAVAVNTDGRREIIGLNRDSPDDRLPSADNLPFRRSRQACEGSNRPRRPHRPAS